LNLKSFNKYLFLEFTNYFHALTIKLHRFYFHYNLYICIITWRALSTNFKVFIVSSILLIDGEILPTIKVNVFPVKESWSRRVSLDSRKEATLFDLLERLAMTLPRVVNDWFIFLSYLKCSLLISSLLLTFSEPAKSQRFKRAFLITIFLLETFLFCQDELIQAKFEK